MIPVSKTRGVAPEGAVPEVVVGGDADHDSALPARRWARHRIRQSRARSAASWVIFALVVLFWATLFRPQALGGPASYVMVSGNSMEGALTGGDLAVVRRAHDYGPGDVVVYRVPDSDPALAGSLVIHRIVGGSGGRGFETRGDNRDSSDNWHPTAGDVVGTVWFRVPGFARGIVMLRNAIVPAFLGAVLLMALLDRYLPRPAAGSGKDEVVAPVPSAREHVPGPRTGPDGPGRRGSRPRAPSRGRVASPGRPVVL